MSLSREAAAFATFGLVNNVLYVVILSAALDLIGPQQPKAVVLLANIVPGLIVKMLAPVLNMHTISYARRVQFCTALSVAGMLIVARGRDVAPRLAGIALASISSGAGEITFLQLINSYNKPAALAGFGTGTGAAGVVGANAYLALTTGLGLASQTALLTLSFLPLLLLAAYYLLLPPRDSLAAESPEEAWSLAAKRKLAQRLLAPYILPLFTVYLSEYLINQGVAPTLMFAIEETPFSAYRDIYPTYCAVYQWGVFVSRSSTPFFQYDHIALASGMQVLNLAVCLLQAISPIPAVGIKTLLMLMVWEGLLGGLVYVNAFRLVLRNVPDAEREQAVATVSIADTMGIALSGVISLWLEPALCAYQTSKGRPWCSLK